MRAESLNALLVSGDDQFCAYVNDCLRWAGAERIGRVRTGSAAQAVLSKKRFAYSVVVIQIVEDEAFDVRFIESMLNGSDIALRFVPVVAVAAVRTKSFYRELSGLGFSSLVLSPVRRALLRTVFLKLFQKLQSEFRNPDEGMLARALVAGDLDYVEERCARALHHHPDEPLYTALLGETAARRQDWAEALKYAELALKRHSDHAVPEATRLKAKALFHTGKKDEAFALLPQVLRQAKGSGQDGAFLVQGLVPILNQYARQLKSHAKIEEALLYYNKALDEPDGVSVSHQILLNMALARFSDGSYRDSLELARRAADASPDPFAKAERLIELLEGEYAAHLRGDVPETEGLEAKDQPTRAGREPEPWADPGSGGFVDASDGLDDDLTEEVDFPQSFVAERDLSAEKDAVFAAVKGLGPGEDLLEEGRLDDDFEGTVPVDLDDIGDGLDLDLESDLDDMDFSVSADDLEQARQQRAEQADALAAAKVEADIGIEAEDDADRADAVGDADADQGDSQDEQEFGGEPDFSDSLIAEALAGGGSAQVGSLSSADEGDILGDLAEHGGVREATDDEVFALLDSEPQENAFAVSVDDSRQSDKAVLSQLLSEADPLAELAALADDESGQDSLEAGGRSVAPVEAAAAAAPPVGQAAGDKSPIAGVKWETLSDDEIEKYIMYLQEYPRLKVKPCPVRPRST